MVTTVFQLSRVDELNSADVIPAYISADGDTRGIEYGKLFTQLQDDLDDGRLITRYAAPSATGFSINAEANTHLILTPAADYATGTIVMPANPEDRDQFMCSCTRDVALLTVNGNGKTLANPPLSLNPGDSFSMKFDAVMNTWYRLASSAELSLLDIETRLNTADVLNQRSDLAGSVQSNLAAHIRRSEINVARDFNLSPGADITAAMLQVLNDGRGWYLPGTPLGAGNDWLVSADLPVSRSDNKGRGDGRSYTRIRATHTNGNIFTWGAGAYVLMHLADMRLTASGTGSPLYFPYDAGKLLYGSEFENLHCISIDGNGMHLGSEFQTAIRSTWAQSDTMHAFFVQGGNTTIFDNTYAIKCGAEKAGYRSFGGGQFNSCNGINSGGSNFIFGPQTVTTDTGDPSTANALVWATLINCNLESFTRYGIKSTFQGYIHMDGGKFTPNASGYVAYVDLGNNHVMTLVNNPRMDIAGTRQANVADGISVAPAADFFRRGVSAKYVAVGETGTSNRLTCLSSGASSVRPMASISGETKNITTLAFRGLTTPGTSVTGLATRWEQRGETVHIYGRVLLTTKDAAMAGSVVLENLPALPNESAGTAGMGVCPRFDGVTLTAGYTQLVIQANSGNNYLRLRQTGPNVPMIDLPATQIAQGAELFIDIEYWAAATA